MDLLGQSRRRRKKPTDFASEFFELYKKYWNKICENAKKFIPQNERIENLTLLADSLENVLEKN